MKTIMLLGATGLVGGCTLEQLLADDRVAEVVAPTRRPLPAHDRLRNPLVDFSALDESADWWAADAVICCLGTTLRKAGSRVAFRRIDLEFTLAAARHAFAAGTSVFVLTSSLGADAGARNFYLQTKGQLEDSLRELAFPSLTLVRPSIIGGERREFRPAETAGLAALRLIGPLVPRRYRISPAHNIAAALVTAAIEPAPGVQVITAEALC